MNKLQMAHDFAMKLVGNPNTPLKTMESIVDVSWEYADAMQAEADKRNKAEAAQKRKEIREMLNAPNTFVEREGQHFDDVEWQPDWSQAPKDAIAYKIVDGIVQYLHGTRSSDGTLCGGYLANDGWIKLEKRT